MREAGASAWSLTQLNGAAADAPPARRLSELAVVERIERVRVWMLARWSGTKNLGEFGPGEVRALIDAMAAMAPGRTPRLLAIRP